MATYLAQLYNGVENVPKRISRSNRTVLPTGEYWHIELLKRLCEPPYAPLPMLFDKSHEEEFTALRKFRHVVHHGYAFQLEWENMNDGVERIGETFRYFLTRVNEYVQRAKHEGHE